jgi:hypothetical protein
VRKREWLGAGQIGVATSKNDLHPKKIMLSVWWGVRGIIYWELLPTGCAINADLYCQQLDRVAAKFQGKQDRIYFLHENARLHIANSTRENLLKLGRVTVPHPPYYPNWAPTDYHFSVLFLIIYTRKNSTTRIAKLFHLLSKQFIAFDIFVLQKNCHDRYITIFF